MDFKKRIIKQVKKYRKIEILVGVFIVIFSLLLLVSNYVEDDSIKVYDLTGNINFEAEQVFYSGSYNSQEKGEIEDIFKIFVLNYGKYIEEGKMPYLLFGNNNKLEFVSYRELNNECTCNANNTELKGECIELFKNEKCQDISTTNENFILTQGNKKEGNVVIQIVNQEYHFKLNPYENFYFIIWKEDK